MVALKFSVFTERTLNFQQIILFSFYYGTFKTETAREKVSQFTKGSTGRTYAQEVTAFGASPQKVR